MQVETIYKLIKLIGYISLTFSDWLLTSGNKFSVTPIEEMNKEELNACQKSFYTSSRKQDSQFYNNMHENYAHCEQGLHRFPPRFNFYNCTNVQVHNNLADAVKLCLVNINRKFFHLLKQRKFDKLDVDLGVLSFIQNNERRIWQFLIDVWHVMKWVKPEIICIL